MDGMIVYSWLLTVLKSSHKSVNGSLSLKDFQKNMRVSLLNSMAQIDGIIIYGEQGQKRCLYVLNMMMDQELLQHPSHWMANGV